MEVITQDDGYYEKKLLSWLICHVLLLLSSINLNVYVINKCEFDLLIYIFLKYYYISNCRVGGGGREERSGRGTHAKIGPKRSLTQFTIRLGPTQLRYSM